MWPGGEQLIRNNLKENGQDYFRTQLFPMKVGGVYQQCVFLCCDWCLSSEVSILVEASSFQFNP